MTPDSDEGFRKRDWRISATLIAVWIVALIIILNNDSKIPLSMLAIATVFFLLLVPAMNDLVRSIDRFVSGRGFRDKQGGDRARR